MPHRSHYALTAFELLRENRFQARNKGSLVAGEYANGTVVLRVASELRGDTLKLFDDFYLKAKAGIWP